MTLTASKRSSEPVKVLSLTESSPEVPMVDGAGRAVAIVWPGVGARERSMHLIELPGGGRTLPLSHPSEAVFYVKGGAGAVSGPADGTQPLVEGSMVHVGPGTAYRFEAGADGLVLIGGPCPFDPKLYETVAMPEGEGI